MVRHILILMVFLILAPNAARTQSIPIPESDLRALMQQHPGHWMIVSGNHTLHDSLATGDDINLGRLSNLPLVLTTFRMLEDGIIGIDDRVERWAPELDLEIPFTVPVTIRLLLAETAGFKVPDWLTTDGWAKLKRHDLRTHSSMVPYIKLMRTASIMTHKDAIGSMALIRVLESAGGKDILSLYQQYLITPLGLPEASFWLDNTDNVPPFLASAVALHARPESLQAMLAILGNNRKPDGNAFLSQRARISMEEDIAWELHPLGPGKTLGFDRMWVEDRLTLSIAPWPGLEGSDISALGLTWFPAADLMVVGGQDATRLTHALATQFLPPVNRTAELEKAIDVRMPKYPGGHYLPDDAPTDWLSMRLDRIWEQSILYNPVRDGAEIWQLGEMKGRYKSYAPLAYRDMNGEELIVRPKYQGGHLYWQGRYYRYAGPFGDPVVALSPFFWMLGLIMTGGIYAVMAKDRSWRKLGAFCLAGPICLALGLAAEINLWPTVWIGEEGFWRVVGWRLILNLGVMAVLSVIFFALSFTRGGNMPTGRRYLLASAHLIVMTIAACVLILMTLAWGIAGSLSPT